MDIDRPKQPEAIQTNEIPEVRYVHLTGHGL
jgi:hypothetical protein